MISIIAAVGKNLELGRNNKLIWFIPNDLEYFKSVTTGKTVVMGRKTYESIGKALLNRKNIVISNKNIQLDNVTVLDNYKDVFNIKEDVFIIGGSSIYELFLPYAENIYLTEIDSSEKADCYFPSFNKDLYEKEIIKTETYNNLDYSFVIYRRKCYDV